MSGTEKISPAAWRAAIGCFIGTVLASGFSGSFSVFLPIISKEFGWGRSVFSAGFFASTILTACCYPLFGTLIDRFGTRKALAPALVMKGACIAGLALMNGSQTQLFVLYMFFGLGGALSGYIGYARLLAGWFPNHRGLALGLVLGGANAVGGIIQPQVARVLIDLVGWREAYVFIGLPFLIFGLPNLLLLKDPPHLDYAHRQVPGNQQSGITGAQALRTATFWIMFVAFITFAVAWEGPRGHMVALLNDRGLSVAYATGILSLIALCQACGRAFEGFLLDRIQSPRIGIAAFLLVLVGLLMIDHGGAGSMVTWGAIILGLGVGSEQTLAAYFVSRYFGMRAYAQLYALMMAANTIALGFGPYIMGAVFDEHGSYRLGFNVVEGMLLFGTILIAMLGPYVYDVKDKQLKPANAAKPETAPSTSTSL